MVKHLPLETIMHKPRATALRRHYYSDLSKLAVADPKRIAEILDIAPSEAGRLINKAREKVQETIP